MAEKENITLKREKLFFREELERKWKIEKKMSFGSNPFGKASVGGDNPFAANTAAPPKTDELKPTFGGFGSGASFGAGKRNRFCCSYSSFELPQ